MNRTVILAMVFSLCVSVIPYPMMAKQTNTTDTTAENAATAGIVTAVPVKEEYTKASAKTASASTGAAVVVPSAAPTKNPAETDKPVQTPEATQKPEKKHTYHVEKIKKKKYVVNEKGKKVRKSFVKVGKKTYYCDKSGKVVYGWFKKGKEYYCASRTSGVIQMKKKVDGIRVKKDGRAVKSKANVAKIKTMMYARKQVEAITKSSDSKSQKLKKCFDWVISFPYVQHRKLDNIYKKKGWEVTFAQDIFTRGGGCCVSDAAAFGFLAKECGYKKVYVGHDTSHGWTEINGRVYDPLFAEAKDYNKYYNATYKTYGLWCVGKRKL